MGLAKGLADASEADSPPLVVIDVNAGFHELGNPDTFYASVKLHLSPDGYAYWTSWVTTALEDESSCVVWRSGKCVDGEGGNDNDDGGNDDDDDGNDGEGGDDDGCCLFTKYLRAVMHD